MVKINVLADANQKDWTNEKNILVIIECKVGCGIISILLKLSLYPYIAQKWDLIVRLLLELCITALIWRIKQFPVQFATEW